MTFDELKNKSKDELMQMHKELKAKIMKLDFDLASNKLKDVSQIKKARKEIARILTVLNNNLK